MHKKIIAMGLCLLMLAGCAASGTDTAAETTPAETTETTTAAATEETKTESTAETTAETVEEITETELAEEVIEYVDEDFWTDEEIQEQLGNEYDLSNFTCSGYYERGGAKLISYKENTDSPLSLVIHCKADETMEILYAQQGPMGFYAEAFAPEYFPDYQNFDYTIYIIDCLPMGNGLPILNWHLTADGAIIDLADTIDFETEQDGLFIGEIGEGANSESVIGLREQIPGTTSVGSSMVVPVTLDENEKIVKVDASLYSAGNVHEWENIDYSSEEVIDAAEWDFQAEIPFYDYASIVIGDDAIFNYFVENSEAFREFEEYSCYDANIARIDGDFDKDGEQEYLIGTNYGRGIRNDIAIVDNGEIAYWGTKENGSDVFSMVNVGKYLKADPYRLTNDNFDEYSNYVFKDYTTNDDNIFMGLRLTDREAVNYYFQIHYNETDGYSIECLRTVGWITNYGEDEDGNIIGRQFVENPF